MTVPEFGDPDPWGPDPRDPSRRRPDRRPGSGLDPMPTSPPLPPPGDTTPDPARPDRPEQGRDRLVLVATGREDRRRHVVDVTAGELGDPAGLRARCGAPVEQVVPGLRADAADCPMCSPQHVG